MGGVERRGRGGRTGAVGAALAVALVLLASGGRWTPVSAMGCESFRAQEDAQAVYEAGLRNGKGDRFGLDPDEDGIACEKKATRDGGPARASGRPVETPTPTPPPAPPPTPESIEADLDAYWATRFADAGLWYVPPAAVVPLPGLAGETGCDRDGDPGRYAGTYCPASLGIFLNTDQVDVPEGWGDEPVWGLVLAHEWGHHVQNLLGLLPFGDAPTPWVETQADCLAGAYFGDGAGRGVFPRRYLREVRFVATHQEPDQAATHGSGADQAAAFEAGFEGGPAACGVSV